MRPLALLLLASCGGTEPLPVEVAAAAGPMERQGLVRRNDAALTLLGTPVKVGDSAPSTELRDNDNKPITVDFADGTVRVVALVPSLDTPTCSLETRTFNGSVSDMGEGTEVLVVSRDLPPAQARFCGAMGIDRVRTLSDFDTGAFGLSWGLLVAENRLMARAVAVVDGDGEIAYLEVVENIPDEPSYDAALAAVAELVPPPVGEDAPAAE